MSKRVKEILSWYGGETPGTLTGTPGVSPPWWRGLALPVANHPRGRPTLSSPSASWGGPRDAVAARFPI